MKEYERNIPLVADGDSILISISEKNKIDSLDYDDKMVYIKKLRFNEIHKYPLTLNSMASTMALIIDTLKEINDVLHVLSGRMKINTSASLHVDDNLEIIGDYPEIYIEEKE